MAQLLELPNELLLLIARYLPYQKDINSFVQTNRQLYVLLNVFLCKFNIQHHQSSALTWAASNGNDHLAKRMLEAGVSIASFDTSETANPLLRAVIAGHISTLKVMLSEKRPDRVSSPFQKRRVLLFAIRSSDREVIDLMIENDAPLNPFPDDRRGDSTLGIAALGLCDPTIFARLLQAGARTHRGEQPDTFSMVMTPGHPGRSQIVELLLEQNCQPSSEEALRRIVRQNDKTIFQLFVDHGFEIDIYGHAALFQAILEREDEMVELLLESGANPHLQCQYPDDDCVFHYRSSIWCAIRFRNWKMLDLLLSKGVHPDPADLAFAIERDEKKAIALLSQFSYESVPVKITLPDFIKHMEDERVKTDPNFVPKDWWPRLS
ncbi:ankyrin repeat protein [Penicillium bovifimosum]|uniref:Ankyrin repeat protein n=1 Tax=Penicillium bovifimosum TaxID=126998 RepID=A0A9W9H0W6_9EURO|nr:ankyrin repeat protein [Penicillium bovifimosum]KAJ5135358.1 ankyrin repeat protein [Penicillium bovifimosum]